MPLPSRITKVTRVQSAIVRAESHRSGQRVIINLMNVALLQACRQKHEKLSHMK